MQDNRERMVDNDCLTDAEIMSAIRCLDQDVCAVRTREEPGTVLGICITLLIVLSGALVYTYLHTL